MSLRIFKGVMRFALPLAGAMALTACSDSPVGEGQSDTTPKDVANSTAATAIPCALNGATEMKTECKHSVIEGGDAAQLLLEGPEGDFRRFTILTDGRGLEAADGAETAAIKLLDGGKIEVSVGDDIYVLPAKVQPSMEQALPAKDGEQPAAAAAKPTPAAQQ